MAKNSEVDSELAEEEIEGHLALDSYQTEDDVIIKAPIAGVRPEDLEVSITDEVVTIKGKRHQGKEILRENYFTQECFWGDFARTWILPVPVNPDKAHASLKDGILTLTIPKHEKTKPRFIKVVNEQV